ncbi:MAG: SUMF1/EgtB/PvdO family nonheme iron enzyme, partial [Chlorobiaceae bacterium]
MAVTLLHVSDFHLSDKGPYNQEVILNALVSSVKRFRTEGHKPDLIFATGDIAQNGKAKEYAYATEFFNALLDAAGLEKERLFIVPGNHDVDRKMGKGLARTLESNDDADEYFDNETPTPHLTQKLQAFSAWYNEYFKGIRAFPTNTTCSQVEVITIRNTRIAVLPLNSALFCIDDNDYNKLFIGRRCLDSAVKQLQPPIEADLKIALLHHPLDWLSPIERANIRATLGAAVDLVLQGHYHETETEGIASANGGYLKLAAGAAYQTRQHPNSAMYATFEGNHVEIFPIHYVDKPREIWTLDTGIFPAPTYTKSFPIPGRNNAASPSSPSLSQLQIFKHDIFISYARKDQKRVEPIVRELEKQGWKVFWDFELPTAETWRDYIKKKLDESTCVLVVWSKISITSKWVKIEADEAEKRDILVPVLLDAVQPPFGFNHIQAADLSDWDHTTTHPKFRQCLQAITSRISPTLALHVSNSQTATSFQVPPVILQRESLNFINIRGALFTMGSPESEVGRRHDETEHQVKVGDFYLCRYAVTVTEFQEFIEASGYRTDAEKGNGSWMYEGAKWKEKEGINWRYGVSDIERKAGEYNHPVVHVSWNDADAYCKWRTVTTGKKFRLPTEAEWEYACRAGTTTPFNTSVNITTDQANYNGNYPYNNNREGLFRENTVAVDMFAPNAWGLHNMHGNVWEWCSDWYGEKYYDECKAKGIVDNPDGPKKGSNRVLRGGSWTSMLGTVGRLIVTSTPPTTVAAMLASAWFSSRSQLAAHSG